MTIRSKKNPIKSLTLKKKSNLKKINKDLSLKLIKSFRLENKREIKKNFIKKKVKFSLREKNQIKNLSNWYNESINREKYINTKKQNQSQRVLEMVNLIYPIKKKKNNSENFFNKKNFKNYQNFDNKKPIQDNLQKLLVNKYNKVILENVIKKGLIRDIEKKGFDFNVHQGNRLVDVRAQSLIKSFSSLKYSLKAYDLNIGSISKDISERINEIKNEKIIFKKKNLKKKKKLNLGNKNLDEILPNFEQEQFLIGNFRDNNLVKNLNNKNIRKRNRRKKEINEISIEKPINSVFAFSGCLEMIRRFKEDIKYIKFEIKKLKKNLEKEEKKLFELKKIKKKDSFFITNEIDLKNEILKKKFKKKIEKDENYIKNENIKFNELLFQGNNIENIRYSISKKNLDKKIIRDNIIKLLKKLLNKFEYFKKFEVNFLDIFFDLENFGAVLKREDFESIDNNLIDIFLDIFEKKIGLKYKNKENCIGFYDKILVSIKKRLKKKLKAQGVKEYKTKVCDLMIIF